MTDRKTALEVWDREVESDIHGFDFTTSIQSILGDDVCKTIRSALTDDLEALLGKVPEEYSWRLSYYPSFHPKYFFSIEDRRQFIIYDKGTSGGDTPALALQAALQKLGGV